MEAVSRHAATRRGRQSLLALVGADYKENSKFNALPIQQQRSSQTEMPARNQRLMANAVSQPNSGVSRIHDSFIARTENEAKSEYEYVAEAVALLKEELYPPIYGSDSSPFDIETVAETDYDTWLELSADESTLEHILQAEKIIEMMRAVKDWAENDDIQTEYPLLAEIASQIPLLDPVYEAIVGTVQINRVRTLTDPNGRSSFQFQLNDERFHVIKILRTQAEDALDNQQNELTTLVENLEAAQDEIRRSLFQLIIGNSEEINSGMDTVARLDVILAKASFGERVGGVIPSVASEGELLVQQFVHPVLLSSGREIVPIDLRHGSSKRALIISGPNGGGKTAAMKSFAVVAILCKLGLPIPCRVQDPPPRVDFFDNIQVSLGDQQNLLAGESTMMAQLNACASILEEVSRKGEQSSMVLFDEIGGGTDPSAGGALAQAVLEKLLEIKGCRIVATSHFPSLKVVSYNNEKFGCATVLLEPASQDSAYQLPSYQLLYDAIGDSYALGAAARCQPALPEDVLSRASQLMVSQPQSSASVETGETPSKNLSYLRALTESMERQAERARSARNTAEQHKRDTFACQKAMLAVASSYDRQFRLLEQKLEETFQRLQDKEVSDLELVGRTLADLRLRKIYVKSQVELLKEKGLKLLPEQHSLLGGDAVVIATEGEMNGLSATVLTKQELPVEVVLKMDDVAVTVGPSWDLGAPALDPTNAQARNDIIILKRSQVAIWDYDSVWEDEDFKDMRSFDVPTASTNESQRKLNGLLSSIKTGASTSRQNSAGSGTDTSKDKFSSSRERKAAAKTKPRNKKRGRR